MNKNIDVLDIVSELHVAVFEQTLEPELGIESDGVVDEGAEFDFELALLEQETDSTTKLARRHLAPALAEEKVQREKYFVGTLSGVRATILIQPSVMERVLDTFLFTNSVVKGRRSTIACLFIDEVGKSAAELRRVTLL